MISFPKVEKVRLSEIKGLSLDHIGFTMRLESNIYFSKFNIIFILYKYNLNVNQVEIQHIVLIKLSSEEWLVKLILAK